MKRRRSAVPDSLDLLLDTICNMFGCVLFLAILIAVLIRAASSAADEAAAPADEKVSAAALDSLDHKLLSRLQDRATLAAAVDAQRARKARFADPEAKQMLERATVLEHERREIDGRNSERLRSLGGLHAVMESIEREIKSLNEQLATARSLLVGLRSDKEKEVEARSESLNPPRLRSSLKGEAVLVLRFGRLYIWHRYDALGRRIGINWQDMTMIGREGALVLVQPNPLAGLALADGAAGVALAHKLSPFSPNNFYVAIVVYDDSFAEFATVKKTLIKDKYDYRLMPAVPGEEIFDHGGQGGLVQ